MLRKLFLKPGTEAELFQIKSAMDEVQKVKIVPIYYCHEFLEHKCLKKLNQIFIEHQTGFITTALQYLTMVGEQTLSLAI